MIPRLLLIATIALAPAGCDRLAPYVSRYAQHDARIADAAPAPDTTAHDASARDTDNGDAALDGTATDAVGDQLLPPEASSSDGKSGDAAADAPGDAPPGPLDGSEAGTAPKPCSLWSGWQCVGDLAGFKCTAACAKVTTTSITCNSVAPNLYGCTCNASGTTSSFTVPADPADTDPCWACQEAVESAKCPP